MTVLPEALVRIQAEIACAQIEAMTEKEHQYYRRCALCDPDLIVCPVCNGSGKVPGPSGEDDLLVDEGTYPVSLGRLLILDSAVQGEKPVKPVFTTHYIKYSRE